MHTATFTIAIVAWRSDVNGRCVNPMVGTARAQKGAYCGVQFVKHDDAIAGTKCPLLLSLAQCSQRISRISSQHDQRVWAAVFESERPEVCKQGYCTSGCDEQGLPHMSAEELVNEDVTPAAPPSRRFHRAAEGNVGAAAWPPTVYSLYQVEAAFVRLFRGAGIDCAVHKAKKAIEEAVFALW